MPRRQEVDMPIESVCDFCGDREVVCCYPARNFIVWAIPTATGRLISESVGDWAACAECRRMIEAGDSEALLNRSVRTFVEIFGHAGPDLVEDLRRVHQGFFTHRCGLAVEVATASSGGR
jgi:hypothetical protein